MKSGTLAFEGFGEDIAIVVLGYFFAHSQSDTCSLVIRLAVEPLEDIKYLQGMIGVKANAVILEGDPKIGPFIL